MSKRFPLILIGACALFVFVFMTNDSQAISQADVTKILKGNTTLIKSAPPAIVPQVRVLGEQKSYTTYNATRPEFPFLNFDHKGIQISAPKSRDIYVVSFWTNVVNGTTPAGAPWAENPVVTTNAEGVYDPAHPDWGKFYFVPKGTMRTFNYTVKSDTSKMFAGVYKSRIAGLTFTDQASFSGSWYSYSFSSPQTNATTIIGEKSPYITSFNDAASGNPKDTFVVGEKMLIKGQRLNLTSVYIDGVKDPTAHVVFPSADGSSMYYFVGNLSVGQHYLVLENNTYGKSNAHYFQVTASTATPIVISNVSVDNLADGDLDPGPGITWPTKLQKTIRWNASNIPAGKGLKYKTTFYTMPPGALRPVVGNGRVILATPTTGTTTVTDIISPQFTPDLLAKNYDWKMRVQLVNADGYTPYLVDGREVVAYSTGTFKVKNSTNIIPTIVTRLVSTSALNDNGSGTGGHDVGSFSIVFDVTASGQDVYLDGDVVATATPSTGTDGLAWATTTNSTNGVGGSSSAILNSSSVVVGDVNTPGAISFKIAKDTTRRFTLRVAIDAEARTSSAGVRLRGLKWDIDSGDNHANLFNLNLDSFKTNNILLQNVETPASILPSLVSVSAENNDASQILAGANDMGTYRIVFDITAFGSGVYIDGDVIKNGASVIPVGHDGAIWGTTTNSTNGIGTSTWAVLESSSVDSDDVTTANSLSFKIDEGDTRRFTLTVAINASVDALAGVRLRGIKWDTNSDDNHANLYTDNLANFKTNAITLNNDGGRMAANNSAPLADRSKPIAKRPSQLASAWQAFQNFLVRIAVGK
ncbi:MAG: hypothetical protein A2571_00030 [Candidatus Vogelbacteria bacterium RIFOXYD1_FULL_44_32]|uniref:Uncharacterized protein n=1 Tax=Candidatus Vogelbacteria bacterium RIFOXYD1_FULL_44_32 TaxID=1802438 RepID=A0A1G2QDT3_9BACT|nr:MAG: hypothetical protein A2571_00030 [Candidatus Vogelbacteria bacterium RIFOXYD1_FULL_44_32]